MIEDKKRFRQKIDTGEFKQVDLVYEISNRYLILMSIGGSNTNTLLEVAKAWNYKQGNDCLVLITEEPTSTELEYDASELVVRQGYTRDGLMIQGDEMGDKVIDYMKMFILDNNIDKLMGLCR